ASVVRFSSTQYSRSRILHTAERVPERRQFTGATTSRRHNLHSPDSAMDYRALSILRLEAETTFRRAELSPYFMAQILDVEREAYDQRQVVGHLTSCDGTRAVFDPPLADVRLADEWRAANGLPLTDAYL